MRQDGPRIVVVEGSSDLHATLHLLIRERVITREQRVPILPPRDGQERGGNGWQAVLEVIPLRIKNLSDQYSGNGPLMLGVVLDADLDGAKSRWGAVRDSFIRANARYREHIPADPSPNGLVVEADQGNGLDVGAAIWIMPDNQSPGDLEKFLLDAIPMNRSATKSHADASARAGRTVFQRESGEALPAGSLNKAILNSYVSYGPGPDLSYGFNIRDGAFDTSLPHVQSYVAWLKRVLVAPSS